MGIKRNFMFSTVLTASNYIFPFIIYPYVARVLGVENVGICNFYNSVVTYATLISMMGIAIVGIREVAKNKKDPRSLNKTFTALLAICTTFTIVATAALVLSTYLIPDLAPYKPLLWIGVLKLWSNFLLIEWLYMGLEDFKYITIRTILVKFGYLISVFVFIHAQADYIVYFLLMSLMVTVNSMFNCYRAASLVKLDFDMSYVRRFMHPVLMLGVYLLLNSMYTTFNTLYLGIKHDDVQVGYYSTATKIFSIILAVYTAYSGVVMPRASSLLSENRIDDFRNVISKSISALILISVPAALFCMIFTPGIVYLIAGPQYTGAILPMAIVMPLIFIIGYEQILVVQTLTPLASDRIILFNSAVGATVGVISNLLIVKSLAAVGSAIVWVIAEIAVLVLSQYFVKRKIGLGFPYRQLSANLAAYLPYVVVAGLAQIYLPLAPIVKMLIGAAFTCIYFLAIQHCVLRNEIFIKYYDKLAMRLSLLRH